MTESLAAQFERASTQLTATPGFARAWCVAELIDEPRAGGLGGVRRLDPKPLSTADEDLCELAFKWRTCPPTTTSEDPTLMRAVRAESDVRLRWRVTEGATYTFKAIANIPNPFEGVTWAKSIAFDAAHRELAIATWAGALLTRRQVNVPALEAAPTLQQLADWLEHFSKALVLAQARGGMVLAPSLIVGGMIDVRAGRGARPERSHGTFTAGDLQLWKLSLPTSTEKRHALHVDFKGKAPTETGVVRMGLAGGLLRAYLATWALTDGNRRGLFTLDVRRVTTEFYGFELKERTVNGKTYNRPGPTAEREFNENFEALQNIYLEGIGGLKDSRPEALVAFYETDRRVYRHAQLAMIAVEKHFIQVPREVLHLNSKDTPTALGVARLLRDQAREVLRGAGHYRATLQQLATMIGEVPRSKVSKFGAAPYYRALAERLPRIVREGQLGELHLEGEGPNAVATLTPSSELATVYSSLAADRPADALEATLSEGMGRPYRRAKKARKPT